MNDTLKMILAFVENPLRAKAQRATPRVKGSKYAPVQGDKERARRIRQMERDRLKQDSRAAKAA
jgi:hypothetical protein